MMMLLRSEGYMERRKSGKALADESEQVCTGGRGLYKSAESGLFSK